MCDHIERNSLYYHYYYYCVTRIDGGSYRTRPPAVYNTSVTCIRHYYIYIVRRCRARCVAAAVSGRPSIIFLFLRSLLLLLLLRHSFRLPPPAPHPVFLDVNHCWVVFFFLTNVCVTTTTQTDVRRSVKFRRNGIEANVCVCVCQPGGRIRFAS